MATNRQGGPGIGLPSRYPIPVANNPLVQSVDLPVGPISLAAGEVFHVPAGQWNITTGPYTFLQTLDPLTGVFRATAQTPNATKYVSSDGTNVRLANLTGCPLGALITNVGSGYTSAPTVTPNLGGSTWRAIVGGAISTTITLGAGGSGYNHPPLVVISAPPPQGVPATAIATISGGAVTGFTVINQGAGYTTAPTVTVVPDPRDTTATGATGVATLTGSGTITGLICLDKGAPQTTVVTLAFSGGGGSSAAATVAMCLAVTGFTVGAGGAAYGNAQPFGILTVGGIVPGTPGAVVNPQLDRQILQPRQAVIQGTSSAGGAVQTTGAVVVDAGLFQAVPSGLVIAGGSALATTVAQVTMTVGGVTDTSFMFSI